jgi:dTDP-4-amino-4,6-dideoxygalactose transaminase
MALTSMARRHAAWVAGRSGWPRPRAGSGPYDPAADFALGDPEIPPVRGTLRLARRLAGPAVPERRRANFRALQEGLGDLVPEPFRHLLQGASPFLFPIEAGDKPALVRRLRARGIRAVNLWSVPHPSLPAERFPGAGRLRARVVGLPVHQELRPTDLDRLRHEVRELVEADR